MIVSNQQLGYWAIAYRHFFRFMIGRHSGASLYLAIGGGRYIQFNLGTDPEERVAWQFGPWMITRPETEEEAEERAYGEEEQAYQDWCADFYSY